VHSFVSRHPTASSISPRVLLVRFASVWFRFARSTVLSTPNSVLRLAAALVQLRVSTFYFQLRRDKEEERGPTDQLHRQLRLSQQNCRRREEQTAREAENIHNLIYIQPPQCSRLQHRNEAFSAVPQARSLARRPTSLSDRYPQDRRLVSRHPSGQRRPAVPKGSTGR
jgi:hypothetical protein